MQLDLLITEPVYIQLRFWQRNLRRVAFGIVVDDRAVRQGLLDVAYCVVNYYVAVREYLSNSSTLEDYFSLAVIVYLLDLAVFFAFAYGLRLAF